MNKKVSPMIFNADMVRALLAGNKTQTRRPINEYKYGIDFLGGQGCSRNDPKNWGAEDGGRGGICYLELTDGAARFNDYQLKRPFGGKGDLIYVRETWRIGAWTEDQEVAVDYIADNSCNRQWLQVSDEDMFVRLYEQSSDDAEKAGADMDEGGMYHWEPGEAPCRHRPSIHMPRWASRLTLRITDVRVERAQDISKEDAKAEGIFQENHFWRDTEYPLPDVAYRPFKDSEYRYSCPIQAYEDLWNSLYNSWDDNPWVWVYTFKVIRQNVDAVIAQEDK